MDRSGSWLEISGSSSESGPMEIATCAGYLVDPASGGGAVAMVQPSENRDGDDLARIGADPLRRRGRDTLTQSLVRPHRPVIANVLREHGLQVTLTQNDDVIEGLSAYTSKKALARRIHERRLDGRANDANASPLRHAVEVGAVLVVPVADDELRAVTERRDVTQLLSRPGFGRTPCDSDADHLLRVDVDDEEREERTEPDVVGLQEVAGPHRMVAQEGVPPLAARRSRWSDRADVLLDCPLGDVDAEPQ